MPLFRGHVLRSIALAGLLVFGGHHLLGLVPQNLFVFTMTQTSVAIIALSSLMLLTMAHHRRNGEIISQTQEEMLLIGAFALFWLAFLTAIRAIKLRQGGGMLGASLGAATNDLSFSSLFGGRGGPQQQQVPMHGGPRGVPAPAQSPPPPPGYRMTEMPRGNRYPSQQSWPCSSDAVHCVVEEWRYV